MLRLALRILPLAVLVLVAVAVFASGVGSDLTLSGLARHEQAWRAAAAREPHRVAFFLYDLAAAFHAFWNMGNDDPAKRIILAQDAGLTAARLFLAAQIGQVIRNGLAILGVEAVEEL